VAIREADRAEVMNSESQGRGRVLKGKCKEGVIPLIVTPSSNYSDTSSMGGKGLRKKPEAITEKNHTNFGNERSGTLLIVPGLGGKTTIYMDIGDTSYPVQAKIEMGLCPWGSPFDWEQRTMSLNRKSSSEGSTIFSEREEGKICLFESRGRPAQSRPLREEDYEDK